MEVGERKGESGGVRESGAGRNLRREWGEWGKVSEGEREGVKESGLICSVPKV